MPRQTFFRILSVFWISTVFPGISSIDDDLVRGRRFGGYRIVPKSCKDFTSPTKSNTGVCMFNYECTQNGGTVVGSCIHGFLFGACCKLLPGASVATLNVPTFSSTNKPTTSPLISDKSSTSMYKPLFNYYPAAETILYHKNGSLVEDHIGPEELGFFSKPQIKPTNIIPQNSPSHNSFTNINKFSITDSSPSSSQSYINDIEMYSTKSQFSSTKFTSPPITRNPGSQLSSNQSNSTLKYTGISVRSTTTPSYSTSTTKRYHSPISSFYDSDDNMVLVPTLTAGEKPQSEGQTNQESINHILSILNNSETGAADPEPMVASTKSPSQTLYTWVSVDGKPEKLPSTNYYYSSTTIKPTNNFFYTTSSTSGGSLNHTPSMGTSVTHHIPGPSFQVTPEIKITPKPPGSSSLDPVPTVIVLSSLHTTQKPYQKPVYDHPSTTTIGYNKPHGPPAYQSSTTHKIKPVPISNSKYPSSTSSVQILYTSTIKPTSKPITQSSTITISPKPSSPKPTSGLQETVLISVSSTKPQLDVPSSKPSYSSIFNQQTLPQDSYIPQAGTYPNPLLFATQQNVVAINSTEDLIAFPPVRDPNVNFTATQGEKPLITATTTFGDYGDEDATPQLAVDEQLDSKVHVFVEKIVQSLQGNFEDLEKVLLSGEQKPNITISNDPFPTKRPYNGPNTTKRPNPNKKPTKKPKPPKPLATKPTTLKPTRPTSLYTTLQNILPSKKPTTPSILYTPTTSEGSYIITLPTKKPKPTKKPTVPADVLVSSTTVSVEDIPAESQSSSTQRPYDVQRECGVRPHAKKNGRIVGGKGSSFGEWPWQVLVKEATWLGLFTKNKCGGVLITNRYVITAAHCQPGFLANLVAVFGEYDISGELEAKRSVSKNVRRVIVHRQYDAATFENDIALLELETPITYDSHIVPICMPKDDDDFTGRIATVSGWGRLKYGGGVPSVLQEVQVPVIENTVCQEMFQTAGHAKTIINSFLCAGYANGQRDSCEGDSGGPLMVEREDGHWVLAGTVSHGIKCAAPYLPGVYMRTTYYKPWLQTITGVQ